MSATRQHSSDPCRAGLALSRRHLLQIACVQAAVPWLSAVDPAPSSPPITDLTADAVERGFAHLVAMQFPDGSWAGAQGGGAGVVATCVLAFLAHGHLPSRSPYRLCVERAVTWLLDHQHPLDGAITGTGFTPMYQHGLATLALAETYGVCQDERIRRALDGCVELIARCQNHRGGWRHQLSITDGDESPGSVGQIMALRAAKNAGIRIPAGVIPAAETYVRSCQSRIGRGGDGGWRYTVESAESNWARTGAGCCALQMAGRYDDEAVLEGLRYLDRYTPIGTQAMADETWWYYGAYYTTLAYWFAQRLPGGVERWKSFSRGINDLLRAKQQRSGEWQGSYAPYETSVALLVLSFPNEYLPIHQI